MKNPLKIKKYVKGFIEEKSPAICTQQLQYVQLSQEFSEWLDDERKRRNLNVGELADLIGMDIYQYSKNANGHRLWCIQEILHVGICLDVNVIEIIQPYLSREQKQYIFNMAKVFIYSLIQKQITSA